MQNSGSVNRWEQACFYLLLFSLFWAPLPFASNRVWSIALLAALSGIILLVLCALIAAGRARVRADVWRPAAVPLVSILMVQVWVAFQMVPLPVDLLKLLSPQAAQWHLYREYAAISLDINATSLYLLRGLCICMAFVLTLMLVNSASRVVLFLQALVLSGLFQATYGSFMVLSGLELGFFVEKYASLGVATGTFVNRNHLAGYLVMCLAAGIGLLIVQLKPERSGSWRPRLQEFLALMLSPTMRLRVYLAVMVIALVLTRSRMGNIAFFLSLALAGLVLIASSKRVSLKLVSLFVSLLVVDVLILSRWFGLNKLFERFESVDVGTLESEGRYWLDYYSWDYFQDFRWAGSGGGSFYGVFPNYQGEQLQGYFEHVHNDYLELLLELGPVALALLAIFLGSSLIAAIRLQLARRSRISRAVGFTVAMAIFWALIHSLADFNLQVLANAYTLVALCALAFAVNGLRHGQKHDRRNGLEL